MSYPTLPEARIVVGLDFGTTFSGFAYAHKTSPEDVHVHYEWPAFAEGGGKSYCKTKTILYYKRSQNGSLQFDSWGWQAQLNYTKALDAAQRKSSALDSAGVLITRFKLHLADKKSGPLSAAELPRGLSVKQVITDFLREIGKFIMDHLRLKYGAHVRLDELQWCVTVPSIWGDQAKQQMKRFMELAGLVAGGAGSPYPVVMVLEPEAAAVFCLKKLKHIKLLKGETFLVADIGGGTSDIVVQEKANSSGNLKVREVTASTGGLCGGSYVDQAFMKFLSGKIGCLNTFLAGNPKVGIQLQSWWENVKSTFDGTDENLTVFYELTAKLTAAWEDHDSKSKLHAGDYSEVEITYADMVKIFDGVVTDNVGLIRAQLSQKPNIRIIMVVGGFSSSKYLMKKIKEAFPRMEVVSPNEPGRAICDGAVEMGIHPENLVSRISRRTYGILSYRAFSASDPESSAKYIEGVKYCSTALSVFVTVGTQVEADACKEHSFFPIKESQGSIHVAVHSSDVASAKYITENSVKLEGGFDVDISSSMHLPLTQRGILVTMKFGSSIIEVGAQPKHLIGTRREVAMLPVTFDMGYC